MLNPFNWACRDAGREDSACIPEVSSVLVHRPFPKEKRLVHVADCPGGQACQMLAAACAVHPLLLHNDGHTPPPQARTILATDGEWKGHVCRLLSSLFRSVFTSPSL